MQSKGVLLLLGSLVAAALGGCIGGDPLPGAEAVEPLGAWGVRSALVPTSWSVFPGDYRLDGNVSRVLQDGPYKVLEPVQTYLTSQLDGADIDLTVWRADAPPDVKQPVIVQASPYFTDTSAAGTSDASFANWNKANFVPHGYAYVQLAIRSTGDSGGCDDFRGPNMVADLDQAVTWLAEQPWSNGNVGLIGISYPGGTPWYAAGTGNPHIKTIVPASGTMDAWEVYLHNGTPESRAPIIVANYGASPYQNDARSTDKKVANTYCPETLEAWQTATRSGATGERVDAAWWDQRNAKPAVEANYRGSVFLVHGLDDWNVDPAVALPWVDHLNQSGLHVKQLLGHWQHEWPDSDDDQGSRWDWAEMLLRWFDKWLKGADVDTGPAVQVQDNLFRWRDEAHWPPRDAEWMRFHLASDGVLATDAPGAGSARLGLPNTGTSALADVILGAPSHLDFRTGPVEEDLLISGLPRAHVTVVPDGPGGFIAAWLYSEDPASGELTRLGWSGMNLRYADGGRTPTDVTAGEPLLAKVEVQPMDGVVPAGHNLVLRLWMEPPEDRIVPLPAYPYTVQWGGGATSVLEIPVVQRADDAFYEAPHPEEEESPVGGLPAPR